MQNEPSTVRIQNANYAGGALLLFGLIVPVIAGFVWWVILTGKAGKPSGEPDWAFVLLIGGPTLMAGIVCPLEAARQAVLWLEVGPCLRYRTLLGIRTRDWSEVRSWGFEDERGEVGTGLPLVSVPLGKHRILSIKLGPWTDLRVKVRPAAEPELRELIARWNSLA